MLAMLEKPSLRPVTLRVSLAWHSHGGAPLRVHVVPVEALESNGLTVDADHGVRITSRTSTNDTDHAETKAHANTVCDI